MGKWFWRVLGLLVVALIVAVAGGWLYVRTSLPQTTGADSLAGLTSRVEIVRDADGVPHIFAANDADAFFALGYVHAQDRMWQMEFHRRIGAGRLSEILGEATLDTDKYMRTLGVYRAAQASLPALSQRSRMALDAYVAGINAWIAEGHTLPPEFLILGVKPEPWTAADSLVWSKLMAYDLGGNLDTELIRTQVLQALGPERTAQFLPNYPQTGVTILAARSIPASTAGALLQIDGWIQDNLRLGGLDVGSNNWVISGERTETGLPMLANDPHLGTRIPSIWYLVEMQGDNIHVSGATFPGLPGVIIGHNEQIAWGVTNLGPDVQDLYLERINPDNLNQYAVDGRWVDMEIVEEPIGVKGQEEPIRWAARSTRHGPLLSDVSGSASAPVALRWTALDPGDTTMDAFLGADYAANWEDFTTALQAYVAPSQNFVYADREGNIGYYGPGRIPVRVEGHDGMTPVPGWNSEYEWLGWIPFADLPHAYNPDAGFIVTANNKVVPDSYPYFLSNEWTVPYRAQRITDLIETMSSNGEKISLDDMAAIQADQTSLQAQELLPYLLAVQPEDERQSQALAQLQSWNQVATVDSVAMSIYEAWYMQLGPAIFEDDLTRDVYNEYRDSFHPVFLKTVLSDPNSVWCDDVHSAPLETCADIERKALDAALDDLTARLGKDMDKWHWGDIHRTYYPHAPFSKVDALRRFFDRSIPNGGDSYTVNVGPVYFDPMYQQRWVPSYRQIVDLGDLNRSRFMHTTGQSGNVLSPHYDDLIERHQAVQFMPMSFGRENVNGDILLLTPQ